MISELQVLVAAQPFFEGLSAQDVKLLAQCAMHTQFEAGQVIFREGDPANRFYLIVHGKVALESRASDRDRVEIQTVGDGGELSWGWIFPPYCEVLDARALEPTEAIFSYGTRLVALCEKDHVPGSELMKRTAQVIIQSLQVIRKQLEQYEVRCDLYQRAAA